MIFEIEKKGKKTGEKIIDKEVDRRRRGMQQRIINGWR
jgi:hypothetical protein